MGRKISISRLGAGLAFLLTLAATVFLIPKGNRAEIAGELSLTPSALPTPSIWEKVSLGQISFGPPRVVLTDNLGFRIVGWISNNEVLILRDTKPGGHGEAIEIFNAKTGEVRRLVEGRIWGKPLWSPWARAIAYLLYNEEKTMELVWHPIDGKAEVIGSGAYQPVVLAPEGKGAMAYSPEKGRLVGKVMSPSEKGIELAFSSFAPPGSGCGWKYDTAVSPDGEWQAVYNCEHFLLMDTGKGVIKEIDLGKEWGLPRWALDAQWSPDGEKLAVVASIGDSLPRATQLLLLDLQGEHIREIEKPPGIVLSELDWAPGGRVLLTFGDREEGGGKFTPVVFLIDTESGDWRELDIFPSPVAAGPYPGSEAAWSPDGRYLLFYCSPRGVVVWRLCLSPVEVRW